MSDLRAAAERLTPDLIADILKDVALIEPILDSSSLSADLCQHVKCLASAVEELQSRLERFEKAEEIMKRRGWSVHRFSMLGGGYGWSLINDKPEMASPYFARFIHLQRSSDPTTALIEADKWAKENGI